MQEKPLICVRSVGRTEAIFCWFHARYALGEERATLGLFSGSDLVSIVEEQGEDEKAVEYALPRMRLPAAGK